MAASITRCRRGFLSAGQRPGKHPLLHGRSRYSPSCLERNPFYSRSERLVRPRI